MPKKISIEKKKVDPWLDEIPDTQRRDLKDFVGKNIEIKKGFIYENKAYGNGFTFLFSVEGNGEDFFTTSFGKAIVRQAQEEIIPVLETDSVIVKVAKRMSKTYNTEYCCFEEAE